MIWASAKGVTVVTTSTRVQFTVEVTIYNVWVPGKEVKAANSNLEHNNHRVEQGDGRMIQQQTNTLELYETRRWRSAAEAQIKKIQKYSEIMKEWTKSHPETNDQIEKYSDTRN